MYAIVQTGGKQYRVTNGDVITVEKLEVEAGQTVILDKVILISDENGQLTVGAPYIEGAGVETTVVENGKAPKVYAYKYKAKKDSKKKIGHRQPYTKLEVWGIKASGVEAKAEAPKAVNFKSMKKAELIAFAKENNIELNEKATNAEMIAVLEAAIK